MRNKKLQHTFNASLSLLAAALLAVAPMAIANAKGPTRDNMEEAVRPENDNQNSIWTTVETTSSIPSSFRNQKANQINDAEMLRPIFDTLCYSGRPLRILQLGDSHVAGKLFPNTLKQILGDALGTAENDTLGTGIRFDYMAKNGATAHQFLTPQRLDKISSHHPDLIILSFGTNECHGMGYRETDHEREIQEVLDSLQTRCPKSVLLLTTPPGDYLSHRQRYYVTSKETGKKYRRYRYTRQPNPMSVRCATLLAQFGKSNHLPVWNLNDIAGGSAAVRNWTSQRLMRKDHIHFTPEGYQLQGRLLGEALLKAYNEYINTRNTAVLPPHQEAAH